MIQTITKQIALDLLAELVAEKGEDYVYPRREKSTPSYSFEGAPDCGVGHVLYMHDPSILEILVESGYNSLSIDRVARSFYDTETMSFTVGAVSVLLEFQTEQDMLVPYGKALEQARRAQSVAPSLRANALYRGESY